MDKVRPENQSEHTPVSHARHVASPSFAKLTPQVRTPRPPPQPQKKKPPARPDGRPRLSGPPPMDKVRPENQSEHTPVSALSGWRGSHAVRLGLALGSADRAR